MTKTHQKRALVICFCWFVYRPALRTHTPVNDFPRAAEYNISVKENGNMNKGEMAVIATISWIAGLVILAVVFTIADAKPSDYPGWLLLIIWLTLSKVIHTVLTSGKKK